MTASFISYYIRYFVRLGSALRVVGDVELARGGRIR